MTRPLLVLGLSLAAAVACGNEGASDDSDDDGSGDGTSSGAGASFDAAAPGSSSGASSGNSSGNSSSGASSGNSSGNGSSGNSSSGASSSGASSSSGAGASSSSGGDGGIDSGTIVDPPGQTPWDASPCLGAAVTKEDLLAHFAPAATTTTFGSVWAAGRSRACQDQTGCQGWTATPDVDLYRIVYNGNGFSFISPTALPVPGTGTITCTVPGPACKLSVGPMTSNVFPDEQGRALGITPRIDGAQVQVGSWSTDPQGTYLQYTSSTVTASCLWGTMSGRQYGASGTYEETQLVVWGAF